MNYKHNNQLYHWRGLTSNKQKLSGSIRAASKNIARQYLTQFGIIKIYSLQVNLYTKLAQNKQNKQKIKLRTTELITFFVNLQRLLHSGISICDALTMMKETSNNGNLLIFNHQISQLIAQGHGLSSAMLKTHYTLPSNLIFLLQTGELTGNMVQILTAICTMLKKQQQLISQIKSAMLYPICILVITAMVFILLFTFIIPQFEVIYANNQANLPKITRALLYIAQNFNYIIFYSSIISLLIIFLIYYSCNRFTQIQQLKQTLVYKLPLIGSMLKFAQQTKIAFLLYMMLSAGITLEQALQQVKSSFSTHQHMMLQSYLSNIIYLIKSGRSLSNALNLFPVFSLIQRHQIAIAERTGELSVCFEQISQQLTSKLDDMVNNIKQLIEPFIIVVLGGMIGSIVIAMYLPIFDLGNVF